MHALDLKLEPDPLRRVEIITGVGQWRKRWAVSVCTDGAARARRAPVLGREIDKISALGKVVRHSLYTADAAAFGPFQRLGELERFDALRQGAG
jgi:hypothetical protein